MLCSSAQKLKKIIIEVNNNSIEISPKDSILLSIQKENDFVIGYSVYNSSKRSVIEYFLLGINKNESHARKYLYIINSNAINKEKPYSLDVAVVPKQIKDSVFWVMKQKKIWTLKHFEKDEIYCPTSGEFAHCTISDAVSKDLIIMTKSHQSISEFYAPEFFEFECCPGNTDRQRFLGFIKYFSKIF
jgi:hypothetical protein